MDVTYAYQKKRSEFGKQCLFSDKGPELIDNFASNKKFLHNYIIKDPVSRTTLCAPIQAEHHLNTTRAEYVNGAMNHVEGGWPKDVNTADEEQTKRYRRKVEKDEGFHHTVMQLCRNMENCILQNNAINIYQQYFSDVEPTPLVERSSARTVNVYQDQSIPTRPVTHISWSPDNQTKLAISHCDLTFQAKVPDQSTRSYIWQVERISSFLISENPNTPLHTLRPEHPIVCLEYNQKDPNSLVSGQFNGQVAVWDTRKGHEPVELSVIENSYRDPVHNVLWINSKSGTEWDTRKMSEPTETLILDISKEDQSMSNALGASCLEYETTIPTRFMVGTEQGKVISCNRKGKTPMEKMTFKFSAHFGPVLALQRNPAFLKNFLTVGDWTARIWSEDCRESSIMWTSFHRALLTDGAWSPTRFTYPNLLYRIFYHVLSRLSVFFTTRSDGILDVWDILQQQKQACLGVKVCDEPLRCLRTHEMGRLVAVGNQKGTTYLVEFSENLSMINKNDKMLLTAMFERESKREKILEARNREIRLKQRAKSSHMNLNMDEGGEGEVYQGIKKSEDGEIMFTDNNVVQAEAEFYLCIEQETKANLPPEEAEEEEEEGEDLQHDQLLDDTEGESPGSSAPSPEPDKDGKKKKGKGKGGKQKEK
ncbi:dynein intermediate chain 3, ciliary [Asbolus verrucosus]|uniref:Dynein intermediate chain 3, ciliary n=1 Tax=Asbolus verrucosus TaxID=1661398 RepID=A0A482W175_ASBVE|nr:dynein intermediate chain 3, ciliary [Asbolus verrucosus]